MAKVVLCIHGRSPKPPEAVLLDGCRSALEEGLKKNRQTGLGDTVFDLVYYADIYYQPLPPSQDDEPYRPAADGALKPHDGKMIHKLRGWFERVIDAPLDWLDKKTLLFSKLARKVSKKTLDDFAAYNIDTNIRDRIHKRLLDKIELYEDHEIILIAHSMGTIVAYDVLRKLSTDAGLPETKIPHFITLGSPLGLTPVRTEISLTRNEKLKTPAVVSKSWTNFSDPNDLVCLDNHLKDDYKANDLGVRVRDVHVYNDYPDNPHELYGYLRTPEFSELLEGLLD